MPIVGLLGEKGQQVEFKDYLKYVDVFNFPRPLLHLVVKEISQNPHKGNYISVTALLGCQRQTYLSRVFDIFIDPKKVWWSLRGSLIHKILEDQEPEVMVEENLSVKINGIEIFGRIDYYDPRTKSLKDFKTIGDKGIPFILREGGAKEDHIHQVNMYAYLLEKNGYQVKDMSIIYMSLMEVLETGRMATVRKNKEDATYQLKNVPFYPKRKLREAMKRKSIVLNDAFETGKLPPIPKKETRKWLCNPKYCSVTHVCPYYEEISK